MNVNFIDLLCCPFCNGTIHCEIELDRDGEELEYGILRCRSCCFDYPLVAGIPILRGPEVTVDAKGEVSNRAIVRGPTIRSLVELLAANEPIRAFSLLLNPTTYQGDLFPTLDHTVQSLSPLIYQRPFSKRRDAPLVWRKVAGLGRRLDKLFTRRIRLIRKRWRLASARLRLAEFLDANRRQLSALDVMDLYYRRYSGSEISTYFSFRIGQPRYLAGLSLAHVVTRSNGPILDLACGAGHFANYFSQVCAQQPIIGLDREFFRLYLAKHFLSPQAEFVCAEEDQTLPFRDGFFRAVFCSDALQYFVNRATCVREAQRLLRDDGVLVFATLGNRQIQPPEGYELTVSAYRNLFSAIPNVVMGEQRLVSRYLDKKAPDLTEDRSAEAANSDKWLSLVASRCRDVFCDHGAFDDWPHAVGRLAVNPIYRFQGWSPDGGAILRFEFPSAWYEFENGTYAEYAPAECEVSREILDALDRGERTVEMEGYIRKFVIAGTPERYLVR
jgi:ubiquinone/menaquinone biosynthesis C-methylase UbiE/uncharacterized protein YbaR (Trm112 family)